MLKPIPKETWYPAQRGYVPNVLYNEMIKNDKIWVITCDLGYKQFDKIREDFPDRYIDCGAAEQGAMGVAIGLALQGKIPFISTMTNFVLYRPYEWIRNYVDHENLPVKIIGSGRDKDYSVDSFTHECCDAKYVVDGWQNIVQYWPNDKEEIEAIIKEMISNDKPCFLSLKR